MNTLKVFMHAYGCQMNKLDSELAMGTLRQAGYVEVTTPEEADVILFNTCSVREHAEERVYSNVGALKRLKRQRPEIVIGILGCMAQKDRKKIFERMPHVDIICGTREFPRIAELIVDVQHHRQRVMACDEADLPTTARDVACRPNRFQAYVGIMRGCDNYCAYCIVPYVRGREISRPPEEVIEEIQRLVDDGCREITLLGQNVNSYGSSFGQKDALADLLVRLDTIAGLERLRFVTSHPKDMSGKILGAIRDQRFVCEHLHMPAQSGSDKILAAMNRKYTAAHYREVVVMARELVPDIAIASDFIVGFPGEMEEDFNQTAQLLRDLRFQNSFIFKYSPRPGTRAEKLADNVPWDEKQQRNSALLEIQSEINARENAKFIGRDVEVLVEGRSRRDARRLTGRLRTNHIVVFESDADLVGELVKIHVESATPLTLYGYLVRDT